MPARASPTDSGPVHRAGQSRITTDAPGRHQDQGFFTIREAHADAQRGFPGVILDRVGDSTA